MLSFVYTDWEIFKAYRICEDEMQKRAILYRLYENSKLIEVVNKNQLCTASAQYEDGGRMIEISPSLIYRLALRAQDVVYELASFDYYSDIKFFLAYRCARDINLGEHDVFCLYKRDTLIETFPVYTVRSWKDSEDHPLTARFNPIPTPTTLKPPGFPQDHWRKDEEPDEA